jgi:hypothetical protein
LRQITNRRHGWADAKIEKEALACMKRQVLPPDALRTHRFKLATDGLSFLVQIHVNLDVARIEWIITIYVTFATYLFGAWGFC